MMEIVLAEVSREELWLLHKHLIQVALHLVQGTHHLIRRIVVLIILGKAREEGAGGGRVLELDTLVGLVCFRRGHSCALEGS